MFDVFYSGTRPNLFAHEQQADSLEHAQQLSRTRYFWWVNYLTDYSGWNFLWEPVPWQSHQRHAWPSQWQKDSGTYLVPRSGYTDTNYRNETVLRRFYDLPSWTIPCGFDVESFDWSWHPDFTDPPYIYQFATQHQKTGGPQYLVPGATEVKYVDQIRVRINRVATAVYEIDHMCGNAGQIANTTRTVRYFDNYLDTLRRLVRSIPEEHEFVWICSSICDYTDFDFSWHPEQWQATMLHVFASDGEKFGDTFFMHVPTFRYRSEKLQLLDWYDLNFVGVSVPRRPLPVIRHDYDTHVEAVKTIDWLGPLAVFATTPVEQTVTVPLWSEKTKTIVPLSAGASQVIVPKVAVPYIRTQLYDYAHIDRTQRHMHNESPLDIVFIDNGEPNANENWGHLHLFTNSRHRLHRSSGVTGRVAAYHAAARLSTTPWFFAVFAKLHVNKDFDWSWQPDRMQEPKHYIFHARNPVNGLEYGHQAMIAYNKKLVLDNTGTGLDFTLDSAHEVVPILSGTAYYTDSAWMAWRTAFRECIKLKDSLPNVENEYRLKQWLKEARGYLCRNDHDDRVRWSHLGAKDAVEYWESVGGDVAELRKSYDWAWLATYAMIKRGLVPDQ
jgi:hypothetical protein